MIQITDLIEYARAKRSSDLWAVDSGVTYETALDRSRLPLPCFYFDLNTTDTTIESDYDFLQIFTANIRVSLVCLSVNDRTGKQGQDLVPHARNELFKILLFKKLDPRFNEVYYFGDSFEKYDEARYIHTFNFRFTGIIDKEYLEQLPFDDLKSIIVDYRLVDSSIETQPNAIDTINTLQD